MASIPESTKISLRQKLLAHAAEHWPGLGPITTTFRGPLAYIAVTDEAGEPVKLFRLRYGGYANMWGLGLWRASHEDYQPTVMPDGTMATTPQNALDLAASLYLPEAAEHRRTSGDNH
jgi:hypothetical protein